MNHVHGSAPDLRDTQAAEALNARKAVEARLLHSTKWQRLHVTGSGSLGIGPTLGFSSHFGSPQLRAPPGTCTW